MPGLVSEVTNVVRKSRYLLLAGTMLSTLALPHWSMASDAASVRSGPGTIILAQRDETDPKKKGDAKGKQGGPKGGQPQGGQPQGGQPKQGAQPQQGGQPKQGAQPQQGGQPKQDTQPQQGAQPKQGFQPKQGGPKGGQPKQEGAQPQQGGQPKQGFQPKQGGPKGGGQPKQEDAQPQQGVQPKQGSQPKQGGPKGGQPQLREGAQPQQGGQPKQGFQPKQGGPKGGQPQLREGAQPPQGGQPKQGFQPPQGGQPKGFEARPGTFQPRQGFGTVDQFRAQRRERVEGGRRIIEEPGGRAIIREGGRVFIQHDDSERFRGFGGARVERRGAESFTIYRRADGVEIITVTDANGRLLRRIRREPGGREIVLIDNRPRGTGGFFLDLAPPVVRIPRERYIVDAGGAAPALLYETLEAPPLDPIDRAYSLDEIRYNAALRDRMRRVDIDTITFETGSSEVSPEQARNLEAIAGAVAQLISRNPDEVILIEGHTDAVGSDDDNLSLSDRRAAAVADILSSDFQIPPENLVTQGYGEQFLKVPTQGPERQNRRVTARRITPLLKGASAQ